MRADPISRKSREQNALNVSSDFGVQSMYLCAGFFFNQRHSGIHVLWLPLQDVKCIALCVCNTCSSPLFFIFRNALHMS